MKSRESLIRLHRFKVDEIRRRLKLLDDMRADLAKKMSDLELMMQEEQRRAAHSDLGRLAYPSFARSVRDGMPRARRATMSWLPDRIVYFGDRKRRVMWP